MKRVRVDSPRHWAIIPPWIILCLVVILGAVVAIMAARNTNREKRLASQTLLEKGAAIIRAFESGTRLGMGMRWEGPQFQALLEEMANQPGILYLAVTDANGVILADSNRDKIGQVLHSPEEMRALGVGIKEKWRLVGQGPGPRIFEVYREFTPLSDGGWSGPPMGRSGMWGCDWSSGGNRSGPMAPLGKQVIFVGFDVAPFQEALAVDLHNTALLSAILVLVGVGGVMTLFWAQNSRISRRQLQDTRALSSQIVSNLPVGLITTGSDGRVAVANGAAEKIVGFRAADVIGKSPQDILPMALCDLKDVIDKGVPVMEGSSQKTDRKVR